VFLRALWEPADSPKLAEVYRQAEACLASHRKPPGEVWLGVGEHNVEWLIQRGIQPRYTAGTRRFLLRAISISGPIPAASSILFHAILAAVREYGAVVWLGLGLVNVYKIRPRLFWPAMADGHPLRYGFQKVGGGVYEPYLKAFYCRDEKVAALLLEEVKRGKTIGECLDEVRDIMDMQPFTFKLDLPIIRHPHNVKPPDPAIFQERKQVWRIAPRQLLGGNDPDYGSASV